MLLNLPFNTARGPREQAPARPVRHIHGRSLAKLPLPKRIQAAVDLVMRKAEVEPCLLDRCRRRISGARTIGRDG
jgi:hypothetical protein